MLIGLGWLIGQETHWFENRDPEQRDLDTFNSAIKELFQPKEI